MFRKNKCHQNVETFSYFSKVFSFWVRSTQTKSFLRSRTPWTSASKVETLRLDRNETIHSDCSRGGRVLTGVCVSV